MKSKRLMAVAMTVFLAAASLTGCSKEENAPSNPKVNEDEGKTGDDTKDPTGEAEKEPTGESTKDNLPETLANPDISLVYWYNPDQYAYDKTKNQYVYDAVLEAIPDFEAKYGGKVNLIYVPWNEMGEKVVSLQNAGEAPDLYEIYEKTMHTSIFGNILQDLSNYVTDEDYSYWNIDKNLFSWKGKPYAIPIKPYANYIMYNKDIFEWEGLTAPDELFRQGKWTFDEFESVVQKLTKRSGGDVLQFGFASWPDVTTYFMLANGGALYNVDTVNGTATSMLSSNNVQNTLAFMGRWSKCIIHGDDGMDWFDQGKAAMVRGKEFPVDDLPFEVGVVPFPAGPDLPGKHLVTFPQGFGIPTNAKNPEGAVVFMRMVNNKQLEVGNAMEAGRIGQENYDMFYADDVDLVYAYDKAISNVDNFISSINNYLYDDTPPSTIASSMEPVLTSRLELIFGGH